MSSTISALRDLDEPRLRAVIEVMCLAALADGEIADEERDELAEAVAAVTGGRFGAADVGPLLAAVEGAVERDGRGARLVDLAKRLASPEVREAALAAAVRVMAVDGVVRTSERELIGDLAEGLGLDRDRAADLVRELAG